MAKRRKRKGSRARKRKGTAKQRRAWKAAGRRLKAWAQKEADIDYKAGASFGTRVMVQRADNPKEAALALDKVYGTGNYGQDRFGQWWVKEGDRIVISVRKSKLDEIRG